MGNIQPWKKAEMEHRTTRNTSSDMVYDDNPAKEMESSKNLGVIT